MTVFRVIAPMIFAALVAACASTAPRTPAFVAESGGVLVGAKGMSLYTFDKDLAGSGKSACNGPCAVNWPPLFAKEGDVAVGEYAVITRDDGRKQWTLKGKPLYYWIKDEKAGDKMGDGFNNVWRLAKP